MGNEDLCAAFGRWAAKHLVAGMTGAFEVFAAGAAAAELQREARTQREAAGELDRTAPPCIWLQIDTDGDNSDRSEPWPGCDGVTWQDESVGGLGIQYVRADLASPASRASMPDGCIAVPAELARRIITALRDVDTEMSARGRATARFSQLASDLSGTIDTVAYAGYREAHPASSESASWEAWGECSGAIYKALAAMAAVSTPDELYALDAIPRDPIMDEVVRIRQAVDAFSKHLRAHPAEPVKVPLTDEQIARHQIAAGECPPCSKVMLVSSIQRLLADAPGADGEAS